MSCEPCKRLTIEELDGAEFAFHSNLAELKLCADGGCPFCLLCWTRIQQDWNKAAVERILRGEAPEEVVSEWDPQLYIRGQLLNLHDKYPAHESCIWLSCGRTSSLSPAASHFPQRLCTAEHEPDLHLSLAKGWLKDCLTSHKACTGHIAADATTSMPTRVIDVGHSGRPPRLVETTPTMQERYIALSYCWGPGTDTFTLNHDTIRSMLQGIDEARLVQTHRDLFALARAHDIGYVWIDALCIIQRDADDWERESKRMEQVYENATVTIVAGRADDARNGFLKNTFEFSLSPCAIPISSDPSRGEVFAVMPRSRAAGPVETRGWCFQEALLSRRAIVYGAEQLSYRCRTGTIFEDFGKNRNLGPTHSTGSTGGEFIAAINAPPETRTRRALEQWYNVVGQYSRRKLSNPHDVFAAMSSLARLTQNALGSRYLAGVWECDLVPGLLWIPLNQQLPNNSPLTRPSPTIFAPPPVIRAPSWSWAAVEGPVIYIGRSFPKWKRPDFIKARPVMSSSRWSPSPDAECHAGVLHVPACELQLKARVVHARTAVVEMSPWEYARSVKENTLRLPRMGTHGVLLQPVDASGEDRIFGAGRFDIEDERCNEVWCLQLTDDDGLMVIRDDEGKYLRRGRFVVLTHNRKWFEEQDEVEACLV